MGVDIAACAFYHKFGWTTYLEQLRKGNSFKIADSNNMSDWLCKTLDPNPNPVNYTILNRKDCGLYSLIKVRYLDATNYEGVKIMLWFKSELDVQLSKKYLDPHFNELQPGCIARFVPTMIGWLTGMLLIEAMT